MRISENFKLRNIAGENLVVQVNNTAADMTKVISLNSSSAWLWKQLEGKDFDVDYAVNLLTEHYDVDKEIAQKDVLHWVDVLLENKIAY